jgi:hypothetical protein
MNTQKLTIEQAIQKLNNGFGSIYSKEDVINLLNSIEEKPSDATDIVAIMGFVEESIDDWLGNMCTNDYVDHDSFKFSIEYGNTISLDNFEMATNRMARDLYQDVSYHINESIEQEKRNKDREAVGNPYESESSDDSHEDNGAE